MLELLSQPWHWAFSGLMIAILMFLMLYAGGKFGVSTSFETICAIGGAGKKVPHFNFDWRKQQWLLLFVAGAIIGGYLAVNFLQSPEPVQVSVATIEHFAAMGVEYPKSKAEGLGFIPRDLINFDQLFTLKGFLLMIVGGFLIGFGTRWASGCTSGHAISGLSNLQLASLIAVIGFFAGGLLMSHLLLPLILTL